MGQHSWVDSEGERIAFPLVRDADGYPPADWEHLWAERLGNGLYRIDNTPFFVRGICVDDIVAADELDDMTVFSALVTPSSHCTIRVVFLQDDLVETLRENLNRIGCTSELSHLPNLIAVDVPPETPLSIIRHLLDEGERSGRWEYEEAAVRR